MFLLPNDKNNHRGGRLLQVWLLFLAFASLTQAWPKAEVDSREYKAMLNVSLFSNNDSDDASLETVLEQLQKDLTKIAAAAGATGVHGNFALNTKKTPRYVQFWDTPGTCWLHQDNFILRLRKPIVVVDKNDDGDDDDASSSDDDDDTRRLWEGTLKSRSGDRYHTTARKKYMNDCNKPHSIKKGSRKLEEDVAQFDWTGNVYSFSQKCYLPDDTVIMSTKKKATSKTLPLQIIPNVWDRMGDYWEESSSILSSKASTSMETATLQVVSNATVIEVSFGDFWIHLQDDGDKDDQAAEAKVTLWYHNPNGGWDVEDDKFETPQELQQWLHQHHTPIVAELSFRIKAKHEDWSDTAIMTMHNFYAQCDARLRKKKRQWLDPTSMTKTKWIYKYDPDFCQDYTHVEIVGKDDEQDDDSEDST